MVFKKVLTTVNNDHASLAFLMLSPVCFKQITKKRKLIVAQRSLAVVLGAFSRIILNHQSKNNTSDIIETIVAQWSLLVVFGTFTHWSNKQSRIPSLPNGRYCCVGDLRKHIKNIKGSKKSSNNKIIGA